MNIKMIQKKEYVAPEMSVLEFGSAAVLLSGSDVEEATEQDGPYKGEFD